MFPTMVLVLDLNSRYAAEFGLFADKNPGNRGKVSVSSIIGSKNDGILCVKSYHGL
jgi:hypothetical protein